MKKLLMIFIILSSILFSSITNAIVYEGQYITDFFVLLTMEPTFLELRDPLTPTAPPVLSGNIEAGQILQFDNPGDIFFYDILIVSNFVYIFASGYDSKVIFDESYFNRGIKKDI
jgi:hypothetical protein